MKENRYFEVFSDVAFNKARDSPLSRKSLHPRLLECVMLVSLLKKEAAFFRVAMKVCSDQQLIWMYKISDHYKHIRFHGIGNHFTTLVSSEIIDFSVVEALSTDTEALKRLDYVIKGKDMSLEMLNIIASLDNAKFWSIYFNKVSQKIKHDCSLKTARGLLTMGVSIYSFSGLSCIEQLLQDRLVTIHQHKMHMFAMLERVGNKIINPYSQLLPFIIRLDQISHFTLIKLFYYVCDRKYNNYSEWEKILLQVLDRDMNQLIIHLIINVKFGINDPVAFPFCYRYAGQLLTICQKVCSTESVDMRESLSTLSYHIPQLLFSTPGVENNHSLIIDYLRCQSKDGIIFHPIGNYSKTNQLDGWYFNPSSSFGATKTRLAEMAYALLTNNNPRFRRTAQGHFVYILQPGEYEETMAHSPQLDEYVYSSVSLTDEQLVNLFLLRG